MYIFYFSVVFNAGKEVRMRIFLFIHIMNKIKIKHLIYLDQENVCHVYNGMKKVAGMCPFWLRTMIFFQKQT